MDAVITLIAEESVKDEYGVYKPILTKRDIFCKVNSVTRSEFFGGGRNGLNPEYAFTVFPGDYNGEAIAIYNGLPYSIYRTYHAEMDKLELYVERKGGTNGIKESQAYKL